MKYVISTYKSFVMMLSETIWIYYVIVMFASIRWQQPAFFDSIWLIISGLVGYLLNLIVAKRSRFIFIFSINILLLGGLLIQNWKSVVPKESWLFGLAISIGLCVIFARSMRLVFKKPTRQELLRRFEGNVIYYIIFAVVFTVNHWNNSILHVLFILAIISSLIGMTLTLQDHDDMENHELIKVIKVGQSKWFAGFGIVLLVGGPLLSLLLLNPSLSQILHSVVIGFWEQVKWLLGMMNRFILWLISLFPDSKIEPIPGTPQNQQVIPSEIMEEKIMHFPYRWVIAVAMIVILVTAIWFLAKLRMGVNASCASDKHYTVINKGTWWKKLKETYRLFLHKLIKKICKQLPYCYEHSVYWYHHQMIKWGRKNGFSKKKTETSREYIRKIINGLSGYEGSFLYNDKYYVVSEMLWKLNEDYEAVYYGQDVKVTNTVYKALIRHLKQVSIH